MILIACVVVTGCERIVPSLKVLDTASPSDFVGSWRGTAVDRPNEGTERMTMSLLVSAPQEGRWTGIVSGSVTDGKQQEVTLALRGNKLAFRLPGKGWPMDIWLGLEAESKDSLLGVGLPAPGPGWGEREDSFGIKLAKQEGGALKEDDTAEHTYIRDWLVCGPFPGRALTAEEGERIAATGYRFVERLRGRFLVDYLESAGGETAVRPTEGATVTYSDGTSRQWQRHTSPTDDVRFESVFGAPYREPGPWPYHFAVMYGYTTVQSATGRRTFLEIGTDDSGKAYLNGELVHRAHVIHGTNKRDFVPVELTKGENTLLVKVENCAGPGGFIARIVDQPPKTLANLAMDEEDFGSKHARLCDFLTERGYEWTHAMTPKGDVFVYSVYPRHYAAAQRALLEAVEAGDVQATPIE